jgi:hypothetical protein
MQSIQKTTPTPVPVLEPETLSETIKRLPAILKEAERIHLSLVGHLQDHAIRAEPELTSVIYRLAGVLRDASLGVRSELTRAGIK